MFYLSVYIYYQKLRKKKQGLSWWSSGKDCALNAGSMGSLPGWGTRSQVLQLRLGAAK